MLIIGADYHLSFQQIAFLDILARGSVSRLPQWVQGAVKA